jgi:hypothetical protein
MQGSNFGGSLLIHPCLQHEYDPELGPKQNPKKLYTKPESHPHEAGRPPLPRRRCHENSCLVHWQTLLKLFLGCFRPFPPHLVPKTLLTSCTGATGQLCLQALRACPRQPFPLPDWCERGKHSSHSPSPSILYVQSPCLKSPLELLPFLCPAILTPHRLLILEKKKITASGLPPTPR